MSWLGDHTYVVLNNILSPRRGSPSLGLCIGTTFKKKPKQSPAALLQCPALLIGVYLGGTPVVWLDMSTRWALRLSVRPFAFGPPQPYTSWLALCVVVGPSWSSFGPPSRLWAIRLVFGLRVAGRLGCWAHREVVRQSVWLFDRPCGCSAVGFAMWSCGPPCRRCASRAVVDHRHRR